ncbi:alpha-methylacyl-CoA racemase, partial [Paraphoma chrysanthemicola]
MVSTDNMSSQSLIDTYSIPNEARRLLFNSIIDDQRQKDLPAELASCASCVSYEGSRLPSIAINWRLAESMAALKGFEAAMINVLVGRKYKSPPLPVVINTDHAQLLFMSSLLLSVQPPENFEVKPTPVRELTTKYADLFPSQGYDATPPSLFRRAATNIYRTSNNRFIHLHGSLDPSPTIAALGLPQDMPEITALPASYEPYMDLCSKSTAEDLDMLLNENARQACTVAWTPQEFRESQHGQANANTALYELHRKEYVNQQPSWWPSTKETSLQRPLAGLKVLDLTRVIAGPSISRGLAELGASVMRVVAPHLPDFTGLHPDLNWGKWNTFLDLREESDRNHLRKLIEDADVVVDGYRPGRFEKYGFGVENVLEMCRSRARGVIYARENSYGWHGPWQHRSGWQPISDANTGISFGFGRAMGNEEPCTPVWPNSDYCTGVIGCTAVIQALIGRGELGGSYVVDIALNYYNSWLADICGEYPKSVWNDVWTRNGQRVFRHFESMNVTVPAYLAMIKDNAADVLLRPDFFERRISKALGIEMQVVKPLLQFPEGSVTLRYNVGTRGNGVDDPVWPDDLLTEVV